MNKSIKSRLLHLLSITVIFLIYILMVMTSSGYSSITALTEFFSQAHSMWIIYTLLMFAFGFIATGWNNTKLIKAYMLLSTLSVAIYAFISIQYASNFYIRTLGFILSSIWGVIYFRYRHIFALIYARYLYKSHDKEKCHKAMLIIEKTKSTTFEVFLYYFLLFIFLLDAFMSLYLSVYQAYYGVYGSITAHIKQHNHFNIFELYDQISYYGSAASAVCFAFFIVIEIISPDHSARPIKNLPRPLIKVLKLYRLNWFRISN